MAIKLHRPIPKELANAPRVHPWLYVYQKAFRDLIADRQPGQPIPWMTKQRWAEAYGLDATSTELLHVHVTAQDLAFLAYLSDKGRAPDRGGGAESNGQPGAT